MGKGDALHRNAPVKKSANGFLLTCLFLSLMVEVTPHPRLKNGPGMCKPYFVN